jgi:hypothetical protein
MTPRRSSLLSSLDGAEGMVANASVNSDANASSSLPPAANEDEHEAAQRQRDGRVCLIRTCLILALLTAAAIVATFAGWYVRSDEHANFEMQYRDSVEKVGEAFQRRLSVKRDSVTTFASMVTSRYGPEDSWPNVTIPNFPQQTEGLLRIADGRALSYNPVVTQDVDRLQFEAHATESAWTIGGNGSTLVAPDPDAEWPDNRTVSFGIYSRDADKNVIYDPGHDPDSEDYPDVMVPVWQIAPLEGNERAVMFNLHSEVNRMAALDSMMAHGVPSLTAILQLVQDKDVTRPSAILFCPVFDKFDDHGEVDGGGGLFGDPPGREVVGSVSLVFSWDTFLDSILPDYIRGVVCVLSSSTGQVYSYKISGSIVTLLGEGDLHDPNYDGYRKAVEARLLLDHEEEVGKFVTYTLTMYPSVELEDQYSTSKPAVYAAGAVLIFVFTAGLFLLYDRLVEDRQEVTSRIARQRGNIVNAMFPAPFRDRLYKAQADAQRRQSEAGGRRDSNVDVRGGGAMETEDSTESNTHEGVESSVVSGGTSKSAGGTTTVIRRSSSHISSVGGKIKLSKLKNIDRFMKGGGFGQRGSFGDAQMSIDQRGALDDEPIADLFHDTSIMFSDIVGEWRRL